MTESAFSILLGSGIICIYAADRFNSPTTTRASTTAARYYMAFTTYVVAYLCTYLVLLHNPALLKQLFPDAAWLEDYGTQGDNLPLLLALGLSMLIPKAPMLMRVDRAIKKYLHRLASIPYEAHRLSKEIQSLAFEIPPALFPQLQHLLDERSFSVRSVARANSHPVMKSWVKVSSLVLQLQQWERDEDFSVFVQERSGQFQRILDRYKSLTAATVSADQLQCQAAEQPHVASLQEASERFCRNLKNEENALFGDICDFVSQALLANCFRNQSRCATLQRMGFAIPQKAPVGSVSIHQITWLMLVLAVLLTASFVMLGAQMGSGIEIILLRVAMIVSIYCVAVYVAVNLKAHWRWFQHTPGQIYPAASYVATGIIAMLLATPVSLLFNMLVEVAIGKQAGLGEALGVAWAEYTTYRYPWMAISFLCAMCLSFLIDFDRSGVVKAKWRSAVNAMILMVVLLCGYALVFVWVQSLHQNSPEPFRLTLASLLRVASIIGCAIGYCVPAWFNARQESAPMAGPASVPVAVTEAVPAVVTPERLPTQAAPV